MSIEEETEQPHAGNPGQGELDLQVKSGVQHTETLEKVQFAQLAGTTFLQ